MLTPNDLKRFMANHEIEGEILHLEEETPTVQAAAQVVGTHPEQIIKSLLFSVKDEHVLAIACGTGRIDRRAIAARYEVGQEQVKLADPETVLDVTGYPVGTVPPFGHQNAIDTLIDPSVLIQEEVYAGGGSHNTLLRIDPHLIQQLNQAEVVDLHSSPE